LQPLQYIGKAIRTFSWYLLYFSSGVSLAAALGFLIFGGRWGFCGLLDYLWNTFCNSSVLFIHKWFLRCGWNFYFHLVIHVSRLFFMLKRFPIESKGRRKKLQEVCQKNSVTSVWYNFVVEKLFVALFLVNFFIWSCLFCYYYSVLFRFHMVCSCIFLM
jgi:hypothetical protein